MMTDTPGKGMVVAIVDGPDRFQRRHVWLGFPLAVIYKKSKVLSPAIKQFIAMLKAPA